MLHDCANHKTLHFRPATLLRPKQSVPPCEQIFFYLLPLLILVHFRQLCCLIRRNTAVNNLLNITVHDLIQLVQCQVDTMIGHAALREDCTYGSFRNGLPVPTWLLLASASASCAFWHFQII